MSGILSPSGRACFFVLLLVVGIGSVKGQTPTPEKKQLSPEEIIKAFSAKETEFYEAWMQYSYRQVADVRVLSHNGVPARDHLTIISEVVFQDNGVRDVRILRRAGGLKTLTWTPDDDKVINDIQPFALTAKELPFYNLKYEAQEKVDELECYVFSVKPKTMKGDKLYFEGKIWVDTQDLQVVRTVGKPVPQKKNTAFPEFETIRQMIDKKYWFPVWTHANTQLHFSRGDTAHIEETVTYEDYKRFGSGATIKFGAPSKPPQ